MRYISREFNLVSEENGIITKRGRPNKIALERQWIESFRTNFPDINLVPNIIRFDNESYSYPKINGRTLTSIFRKEEYDSLKQRDIILKILNEVKSYQTLKDHNKRIKEFAINVYINNLNKRLSNWDNFEMINQKRIKVNSIELPSFYEIREKIYRMIEKYLISRIDNYWGIMHGDLNFTNILVYKDSIYFIDPRGSFGNIHSLFGDIRYDLGKLRQCYEGNYDLIVSKDVNVKSVGNTLSFEFINGLQKQKIENLDKILDSFASRKEYKLIEAIQFFSMIPLHNDDEKAQIYFFSKAMFLMAELIGDDYTQENSIEKVDIEF